MIRSKKTTNHHLSVGLSNNANPVTTWHNACSSTEQCVIDQDLSADQKETYTAEPFGDPAEVSADDAADHDSDGSHHKRCQPDGQRGHDDVGIEEGQGYANRHCVDTGTDGCQQEQTEGMPLWLCLLCGTPHAVQNHLPADDTKQSECDPMIDCRDVRACGHAHCPTDHRRDRLDGAKYEAGAEGFTETWAIKHGAFAQGRSEGIGRHAERQDDDGE